MKIGIDAKWFFTGPPSGKVVVQNIVRELIYLNKNDEIIIFLRKSDLNNNFPYKLENIVLKYVWAGNNQISNFFVLAYWGKKLKVDVILFQNFSTPFFSFKKIAYIHDALYLSHPKYYSFKERFYLFPLKYLAKTSDKIITISNEEKKRLIDFDFGNKNKIDFVYHGVSPLFKTIDKFDLEKIANIRRRYNLPDKFLLYVGRLNIRKNIENLIRAVKLLSDTNIPLVIVGKVDSKMSDINVLINELGIRQDRIIQLGYVSESDLYAIFSMAYIFCFPSHAEGFGLPVLEAMASGVPVITSNVTSLPEVCGEAGNYANPNDPSEIANLIDTLLTDKELYNDKRELGIKRAALFTWNNAASQILNIIKNT